ncbi:MAG: LacI family DNA-binding transcriptional regulator [bacterium]|nr:LacI family DNA-binding transcriptional regulator [bacterium]
MNISEIAKLAGVAPATVSRYLNNGYVSAEKKDKIRRIIAETGYCPRSSAQTMRSGKSHLIAVVVPRLASEAIARMVEGITEEISGTSYNAVVATTFDNAAKELECLRLFRDNEIDGVIFVGAVLTPAHYETLNSYRKPIVMLGQHNKSYPCVYFDDYNASYTAVKHLIGRGCRRIANIYVNPENKAAGKARIDGCYDAIKDAGLTYDEKLMTAAEFSSKSGRAAMRRILSSGTRFDGIFCAADSIAFGAMGLLNEQGIAVPDEVKLIAVGSSKYSTVSNPSLTTVQYNYATGGREACKILLERIEGNVKTMKQYKLGFEFVERESTRG